MAAHYSADRGPACGAFDDHCTTRIVAYRFAVTCKRCLASLAKRDREFQWKARKRFTGRFAFDGGYSFALTAARAIAREEGL